MGKKNLILKKFHKILSGGPLGFGIRSVLYCAFRWSPGVKNKNSKNSQFFRGAPWVRGLVWLLQPVVSRGKNIKIHKKSIGGPPGFVGLVWVI